MSDGAVLSIELKSRATERGIMRYMSSSRISLPEELLVGIRRAAEAEHRSVDEMLAEAVERYLEDHSWTTLLGYGAERAKTLAIDESDVERLIAESRVEQRDR